MDHIQYIESLKSLRYEYLLKADEYVNKSCKSSNQEEIKLYDDKSLECISIALGLSYAIRIYETQVNTQ